MAELLAASAAIGVASSLISFSDIGYRVLKRLNEYSDRTKDVPKVIRHIRSQLQLLVNKLEELKQADSDGSLATKSRADLSQVAKTFEEQIKILDKLTERMLPAEGDSRRVRAIKAISSVYYEGELNRTWTQIEFYKTTLIFHFTNINPHATTSAENPTNVLEAKITNTYYHYPAVVPHRLVAREMPLRQIEDAFSDNTMAATLPVVVLLGMGGCGKTQLALQYCQQCKENGRFSSIFWVNASSPTSTVQSFSTIVALIKGNQNAPQDAEANIETLKHILSTWTEPWLIVFDNFDDPQAFETRDIRNYFPDGKNGAILFTSRHGDSKRLGRVIALGEMSPAEGLELLFQQAGCGRDESNLAAAKDITARLGNLALAIDQAGAYISTRNLPLRLFLDHYNKRREKVWKETPSTLWEYRRKLNDEEAETSLNVFTTWEMSFEQIQKDKTNAKTLEHLLTLSAFFDNNDIFEDLFKRYFELEGPDWMETFTSEGVWDSYEFQEAVAKLANLSLISRPDISASGICFSFHPLIQDWIKLRLGSEDRRSKTTEALTVLGSYISGKILFGVYKPNFNEVQILLSHVNACSENEPSFQNNTEEIKSVPLLAAAFSFARLYLDWLQLVKGEPLFLKVVKGYEKVYGPDDRVTLDAIEELAMVYEMQFRMGDAEILYDKIFKSKERSLGPDHPSTLTSVRDLANMYSKQGRLAEAVALLDRVLMVKEKLLGPDDPLTLDSVQDLAETYLNQRRLAEAEALYNRVLVIKEKLLKPDDPSMLDIRLLDSDQDLAKIYIEQGRLAEAEALLDKVLMIKQKLLGPDDPMTLQSVQDLAKMYSKQGRLVEAEALYDRALAGHKLSLGPIHLYTLESNCRLAEIYCKRNRLAEAKVLYNKALKGYKISLGPNHPLMLKTAYILAGLYYQYNRLAKAEALLDMILTAREETGGPDPFGITRKAVKSMARLADWYREQGLASKADAIMTRLSVNYAAALSSLNDAGGEEFIESSLDALVIQ